MQTTNDSVRRMCETVWNATRSQQGWDEAFFTVRRNQQAFRRAGFTNEMMENAVNSDSFGTVFGWMVDFAADDGADFDGAVAMMGAAFAGDTCREDFRADMYDCPCECYERKVAEARR